MLISDAKCPHCKQLLVVDVKKDMDVCPFCNNEYQIESAIDCFKEEKIKDDTSLKQLSDSIGNSAQKQSFATFYVGREKSSYMSSNLKYSLIIDDNDGIEIEHGCVELFRLDKSKRHNIYCAFYNQITGAIIAKSNVVQELSNYVIRTIPGFNGPKIKLVKYDDKEQDIFDYCEKKHYSKKTKIIYACLSVFMAICIIICCIVALVFK